jgi:hypothetical protein
LVAPEEGAQERVAVAGTRGEVDPSVQPHEPRCEPEHPQRPPNPHHGAAHAVTQAGGSQLRLGEPEGGAVRSDGGVAVKRLGATRGTDGHAQVRVAGSDEDWQQNEARDDDQEDAVRPHRELLLLICSEGVVVG